MISDESLMQFSNRIRQLAAILKWLNVEISESKDGSDSSNSCYFSYGYVRKLFRTQEQ